MDIKTAVKIVEQMENDVESLCKCCMPKGAHCIGCREMAITTVLNELKKKQDIIDKTKFAIKRNCIKYDENYEKICCNGDYLLSILEDKEVE